MGGVFNAPVNDVDFSPEEYATMIAVPIIGVAVIVAIIVMIMGLETAEIQEQEEPRSSSGSRW